MTRFRFLVAVVALAACRKPPPAAAPVASYVDPKVCAGCHQEIAASYAKTGMGRSAYPATAASGKITVNHPASNRTYTIAERNGAILFRRHQTGYGGKETNVVEKRAEVVIGSGNHARSYLARDPEGRWVEMPVGWYAENGGSWAMSPGFDRPDHEDFRRVAPEGCLFCHTAYPRQGDATPKAIDCQRCHGPGSLHAEAAARGQKAPIVHPAKLSRERQIELCMQCHLETTSSPLPHAIRRFGRDVYSYKPGEPLAGYMIHFDHPSNTGHDDKFEIAHAAYRLRQSACFLKSEMTCGSCHNPHDAPRGERAAAHYKAACLKCHPQSHNQNQSCAPCHMPKRRAEDAVHVVMTDHRIQRLPPPNLLAPRSEPHLAGSTTAAVPYYPPQLEASPENEVYLALAQVQHAANPAPGIARLDAAVRALPSAAPELYFELGKAYSKAGNEPRAAAMYEEALKRRSVYPAALKGLTASRMALGEHALVAAMLEQAPEPDAATLTNHGHALLKLGRTADASAALQRALTANPDLAEAANLMGLARMQSGDAAGAEVQFREAIRLQPELAGAHGNLASVLAGRKDLPQARYHFQRSLALNPADSEVRRSFAFLLILMREYPQALVQLQEAVRLAPSNAEAKAELEELRKAMGRR